MDALCVIPARGGSKRLERKNVRELDGKPLLGYAVEAAIDSGVFDETIVSTEDEEIAAVAEEYGAAVPFRRPEELATDTAQVVDVCAHALKYYRGEGHEVDQLGVLLPTVPLRTAEDVRQAYKRFQGTNGADFVMCVTDYRYSPFEALEQVGDRLQPLWDDESLLAARSQDRPDVVVDNGAAYIMDADVFEREMTFYGEDLLGHYMPPERSIDVDDAFDFKLAEFIINYERS